MAEFTQPEPINHNELKRMLIEAFYDLFDALDTGAFGSPELKAAAERKIIRRLDTAILSGDDS